ncbi:hypothetical protein [Streptomyces wedmorensis]|uniref:hypothetical protein n=1 Tax=Streptomyces wedmorensis TaxID=43759 RepID=UPI0037B3FBA4
MLLPEILCRRWAYPELVIDLTTPEARSEYELVRTVQKRQDHPVVDFSRPAQPPPRWRREDPMLVAVVRKGGGHG